MPAAFDLFNKYLALNLLDAGLYLWHFNKAEIERQQENYTFWKAMIVCGTLIIEIELFSLTNKVAWIKMVKKNTELYLTFSVILNYYLTFRVIMVTLIGVLFFVLICFIIIKQRRQQQLRH